MFRYKYAFTTILLPRDKIRTPRQRKSIDPPDTSEMRRNHRQRTVIHTSRCRLEPLEENSFEGKSKASNSLELNPNRAIPMPKRDRQVYPLPKKKQQQQQMQSRSNSPERNPKKSTPSKQMQKKMSSSSSKKDIATLSLSKKKDVLPTTLEKSSSNKKISCTSDKLDSSNSGHKKEDTKKQPSKQDISKAKQQQKKHVSSTPPVTRQVLAPPNLELSELTFLALPPDPPDRYKSERNKKVGGQDPPAVEKSNKQRSTSRGRTTSNPKSNRRPASMPKSQKKEQCKPPIQSILKKKDVSPPKIAFFGGQPESDSSNSTDNVDDIDSAPSTKAPSNCSVSIDCDTVSMASTHSASTMKSAIRRGKFAASIHDKDGVDTSSSDDEETIFSISTGSYSSNCSIDTESFKFDRTRSHYMRTADLGFTQYTIFAEQFLDDPSATPEPHFHHPTPAPPPGVQFNIDENWITIDDGNGGHSPIAPQAVDALVAMGYRSATDPSSFTPTKKTRKYMTEKKLTFDALPLPGPKGEGEGSMYDKCLLWTGKFAHRYYGSELPVIRSQGFVNMSAESLVNLLMDSSRVEEYNKTSVGRSDEVVLSYGGGDLDCPFAGTRKKKLTGVVMTGSTIIDGTAVMEQPDEQSDFESNGSSQRRREAVSRFVGATKLVRSTNKVPFVRKPLEFTTLMHCRELTEEQGGANGYIIVGRAITPAEDVDRKGVIRSEVLSNVIIIRRLHQIIQKGNNTRNVAVSESGRIASRSDLRNRCLVITMNHVKSPLIPKIIAKKVGLQSAKTFMEEVRSVKRDL